MNVLVNYECGQAELEVFPLEKLALFVLTQEGKPLNTEVSISFVDNDKMASLNEKYRNKQGPTDVLSFECDNEEDEVVFEGDSDLSKELSYTLGDVIIAPEIAKAQTAEFGTSFEEEINLLLVHGLLHLCGYDHMEDDEAEQMEQLEADILKAWTQR